MESQNFDGELQSILRRSQDLLGEMKIFEDYLVEKKKEDLSGYRSFRRHVKSEIRRLEEV